ncbi:MAG: D-xylose ABC transporter ATP-binding protein [Phototrophicales bacterium]|nr:MAG: D-xylose ABC transporter ATP-binding protein [Phototrophicales bacterium]
MRNISKSFGGVQALKNVSFLCHTGSIHALVGENGAGKSTLMKILAGAYHADAGEIVYKGVSYRTLGTRKAINIGIRVIYQELNLIPEMSVAENIFLGHEPRNFLGLIDNRQLHARSAELLGRLGVELDLSLPVGELTVANQQMVEIAKSLSQDADLLVMDEPSAILAGHELEQLFKIIEALNEQGVTIVYISHRLEEIFQISDTVTVLKDGEVVGTYATEDISRAQLIHMMVGRSMDEVFPEKKHEIGDAVLVAENITTDIVKNPFNLTLHAGEILGVAGMVGSGRTELARALFGADVIRSGRLLLNGRPVNFRNPKRAVDAGIAFVPEDRKTQGLFMGLPIRNNITIVTIDRLARYGIIQRQQEQQHVTDAQRDLSIVMASQTQEVQFLSGGNQQKVVLAKWLETSPSVVILDEPTRGVDVGAKFEIYELMRQLTEQGVAILMISSELPEILGMSDRILVMHEGHIAGEFSREEATEENIIEVATTGTLMENVDAETN